MVVRSEDGRATLQLAAPVPGGVVVHLVHLPDGDDPAAVAGSHYRIEPADLRLGSPARLTIRWDSAGAPGGARSDDLFPMQRHGKEWIRVAGEVTEGGDVAVRWVAHGQCSGAVAHALDFRLGTWDYKAAGYDPGRTVVTRDPSGCALLEEYADVTGGHATSLFLLDAKTGIWHVTTYDPSGRTVMAGRPEQKGIAFFHSTTDRELYLPLTDSTATWRGERSSDGGKTWKAWLEASYHRSSNTGVH